MYAKAGFTTERKELLKSGKLLEANKKIELGNRGFTTNSDAKYYLRQSGEGESRANFDILSIKEDGILAIDQAFYINGKLQYMDKDGNVYDSTLEWKTQLSKAWTEAIGFRDDITTYTLDFQLPANWSEECPKPLLDALIDYACGDSWAGGDFGYSWNIDESNMLHINAEFRGYF